MKKVLIIAGILSAGYWMFGTSKDSSDASTTTGAIDTILTVPQIIAKYQGRFIHDSYGSWIYVGKTKFYFEASPYQILNYLSANPTAPKQVEFNYIVWDYKTMNSGPYDGGLWNGNLGI